MEFHLNYTPTPSPVKITHTDKILLIGSCFAENIGEKLNSSKFNVTINPNGILFNPISISKALTAYIKNESNPKPEINNNLYFSFEHHGSFSSTTKEELSDKIKNASQSAYSQLKEAKFLIITFGSAFAYRHIASDKIVANCHKLPQQEFKKELLSVEDIVTNYKLLFEELKKFNPQLNIILTVSPVKYLRDGIVENNLSKSILIQSVHQLLTANCHYFPAYELVTDDLRDYRFYKEDMAHPNEQAINYVWEKFSDVYFTLETRKLNEKIKDIKQAINHRPINENTSKHKEFKSAVLKKCIELESEFPELNLSSEKHFFTS